MYNFSDYFIEEDVTDTIEGDHKGRVLTRHRTGSLDRKKRYNVNKPPSDRQRAVTRPPQVKVLSLRVCVCCLHRTYNTNSLYFSDEAG